MDAPPTPSENVEETNGGLSTCATFLIAGVLAALPWLVPMGILAWHLMTSYRQVTHLEREIQRTVRPDDLREWVFAQMKAHPQGGNDVSIERAFRERFPSLPEGRLQWHIYPPPPKPDKDDLRLADMFWYAGSWSLKMSVWLNQDGTAADFGDRDPWAMGIVFQRIAR